jgi:hypothetical protein
MKPLSTALALVVSLAAVRPARADVQVSYLVDATAFKAAVAGTTLTFSVYSDAQCTVPVGSPVPVQVQNLTALEALKLVVPKNTPKGTLPTKAVELVATLQGIAPPATAYLQVTGTGISPVGPACQLQFSSGPLSPAACPPDAVRVGTTCVDKYEASVWQVDPHNTALVNKIQSGTVTLADLTAGGATQLSPASSCFPSYPPNFPRGGQWTPVAGSSPPSPGVYAVSIPGVLPSTCIDWFRAAQACALSGKHLITNREWQDAAAGTPDPGNADDGSTTCATKSPNPATTGARTNCKSSWGAFDMVGNVAEWVADWADAADVGCTDWTTQTGLAGNDSSCFGGNGSFPAAQIPSALIRGGHWTIGTSAGVFAVSSTTDPSWSSSAVVGFRCAR